MKIQYPYGEILVLSDAWRNGIRKIDDRSPKEKHPIWQDHPSITSLGSFPIGEYDTINTPAGREFQICPPVFQGTTFDESDGHKIFLDISDEPYAYRHVMTDSGDGLTFTTPDNEWINDVGDYAIVIEDNSAPITTGFTIDYANGTVTFTSDMTGHEIRWTGYFLDTCIKYTKSYDNDDKSYHKSDATLKAILPVNYFFNHWTTSTAPQAWTVNGTCNQVTAFFKPVGYDCQLTATAGISKISQTLQLDSSVDQISVLAVARTTNKMQLRVSMDNGMTWSTLAFTADAYSINKWITLLVQSTSQTTATPIIEFSPQLLSGDTSIARVAFIGAFLGGLIP